jgi:hypothetical protein
MRDLLGGLGPACRGGVQSIVARAEGIPLYAVETIRHARRDGRLVERHGRLRAGGELGELAIPARCTR